MYMQVDYYVTVVLIVNSANIFVCFFIYLSIATTPFALEASYFTERCIYIHCTMSVHMNYVLLTYPQFVCHICLSFVLMSTMLSNFKIFILMHIIYCVSIAWQDGQWAEVPLAYFFI